MTIKFLQSNKFIRSALCLVLRRKIGSKLFEYSLIRKVYYFDNQHVTPPHTTTLTHTCAHRHTRAIHDTSDISISKNYVIYLSDDSSDFSPGLADKLKGCLSSYLLCKKYELDFKIYWDEPFELSYYLKPNQYDWVISKTEIIRDSKVSQPVLIMELANIAFQDWINKWVFKKRIIHRRFMQTHLYTNMIYGVNSYNQAFEELFKPSDKLNEMLSEHINSIGKYISVSTRFMGLLGDFRDEDGFNNCLPENKAEALLDHSIEVLKKIISETSDEYNIFIASDSMRFVNRVKQLKRVYFIPGKIGHSKFKCSEEIISKTFIDFFMLKNAHISYLLKSKEMYGSGFPWLASQVGGHEFITVEF